MPKIAIFKYYFSNIEFLQNFNIFIIIIHLLMKKKLN